MMLHFVAVFVIFYTVTFLLIYSIQKWKFIFPVAAVVAVLLVWLMVDAMTGGDGPSVIGGVWLAQLSLLGLFSGFAAQVAVFFLRKWKNSRTIKIFIGLLFYFLVPLVVYFVMYTTMQLALANRAPPSESCSSKDHTARIGDITLALPLIPVISVGKGREYDPTYNFQQNEQSRKFCTDAGRETPILTNVNVDLEHLKYETINSWFCAKERDHLWWKRICKPEEYEGFGNPVKLVVYDTEKYSIQKMHAYFEAAYKKCEISPGSNCSHRKTQYFDVYSDAYRQYWVSTSELLAVSDEAPFSAECFESGIGESKYMYCETGFRISNTVGVVYSYKATEEQFMEHSIDVKNYVKKMISVLTD